MNSIQHLYYFYFMKKKKKMELIANFIMEMYFSHGLTKAIK